jgi:stage V sporulation protein B
VLGLIFASALFFLSQPLARLQGNIDIRAGYLAVAPAVLVVAVTAAFKGWFQGNLNMRPSAFVQIVEQLVKMAAGLILAWYLMPRGIMWAVTGALLGLTLSEIISFFTMVFIYALEKKNRSAAMRRRLDFKFYAKDIIKLSMPIFFASIVLPVSNFADSLLVVNIMKWNGVTAASATAQYGILTGPVNSLINMPVILSLAVAITIIPVISQGRVYLDACGIKQKSTVALKTAYIFAVPAMITLLVFARPIMELLYPAFTQAETNFAVYLLMACAVNIVLLSQVQIYNSMLQALDKAYVPLISLVVGLVIKITLDFILIPRIGIYGAAVSNTALFVIATAINGAYFRYLLGGSRTVSKNLAKITAAGIIMGATAMLLYQLIPYRIPRIIIAPTLPVAVYFFAVLFSKIYTRDELETLPLGDKISRLTEKLVGLPPN